LSTYNRLQSDSHFRRRKNLEQLHAAYIRFATEECYPSLVQIFDDYNQWIIQRCRVIERFRLIEQSYEKQCEDILNYVDMIDELRQVVYTNIRDLTGTNNQEQSKTSSPMSSVRSQSIPTVIDDESKHTALSSGDEDTCDTKSNKKLMNKIRGTTKKRLHQAEEGFMKLDQVLRQFRTNIQKK
jgi:hypothetical protein